MRIRVTTSINVRSNTVPSTPIQAVDAFSPLAEEGRNIVEKVRSKSPLPILPTRSNMATSRFMASQRPPKGSRLSAWIHGFSVVNDDRGLPSRHNRKTSHTSTYCYSRTPRRRSQDRATGLRPINSTRGVIDPVHPPSHGTFPILTCNQSGEDQHRPLPTHNHYHGRIPTETDQTPPGIRHRRTRTKQVRKKGQRIFLASTSDPKVRWKIVGCLLFGTILTILLTTYLALAISNSVSGVTFHALFIFFILVLTIIFSHYLIRLCMLAFQPQKRFKGRRHRNGTQWPSDEEAGLTQLTEPIPIVLARDEELDVRDREAGEDIEDEGGSEKDLPAPPPVYGNWRGSRRADPDLIHWQLHTNQPDVQREARALIFAGSGHRPPSYASNEMVEGLVGERTVERPLPLFAERRTAGVVLP